VIQNVRKQIRSLEAGALLQGINKCLKESHTAACNSEIKLITGFQIFFSNTTTCSSELSWSPRLALAEVSPTSEVGTPMRRSYVVPMV